MKNIGLMIVAGMMGVSAAQAVVVTAGNSSSGWLGFMNVYNRSAPVGDGAFQFASPWGVADLNTTFDDGNNKLTLSPNTIGDPNPYWYTPAGGPGATGNKTMEANLYYEATDTYNGQTVSFNGVVLSNTFTAAHVATIFVKDFAPDYSSFNATVIPMTAGAFSVSLATDPGAGRHVQWGFQVVGQNVWFTDVAPFGSAMIAAPTPGALALLGMGGLLAGRRRRA